MHMAQVETWIRERAYAIWENEGRPEGRERQHWEQATRDVMSRRNGETPAPAKAAGKPASLGRTSQTKSKSGKARRSAA